MRAAGIRALGEPVEILKVDELAPPGADEVLIDVPNWASSRTPSKTGCAVARHTWGAASLNGARSMAQSASRQGKR